MEAAAAQKDRSHGTARTLLFAAFVAVLGGGIFTALFQNVYYSIDPAIFAEVYPRLGRDGRGWPNHHFHFAIWQAARFASGSTYWGLVVATLLPAALACAGLWLFLVRRRGASPVVASLLLGAVVGVAPVLFFATTVEVHATQWLSVVVALWPLDFALRTSSPLRRWLALGAVGVLLLLGHPLHAFLLPFVGFHVITSTALPGERLRVTASRLLAAGLMFGALAILRYFEISHRTAWTVKTFAEWNDRAHLASTASELWTLLVRAHLALVPVIAWYLIRGRDGADSRTVRIANGLLWLVPLAVFVAYVGLFEAGGYFVGLGTLFVGLFARDAVQVLERWIGPRPPWLAPLAFVAALVLSAWVSDARGLRRTHNPPIGPEAEAALRFVRQEASSEARLICFDAELTGILRQRSRRLVTGELGGWLAQTPPRLDDLLFAEFRRRIEMDFARGIEVWYVRLDPVPLERDPRRTTMEERMEEWMETALTAQEWRLPGVLVYGPLIPGRE